MATAKESSNAANVETQRELVYATGDSVGVFVGAFVGVSVGALLGTVVGVLVGTAVG